MASEYRTLRVMLEDVEGRLLIQIAEEDLRPPADVLRFLLREELKRRKLWPPPAEEPQGVDNAH